MFAIGEAAGRSGLTVETIRYYERIGIVPGPGRTAGGRRVYSAADVERLRFIRRCRDLGFPMADAKSLLALSEGGEEVCRTVRDLAHAHIRTMREKIEDLTKLKATLEAMVADCCPEESGCAMLHEIRSGS